MAYTSSSVTPSSGIYEGVREWWVNLHYDYKVAVFSQLGLQAKTSYKWGEMPENVRGMLYNYFRRGQATCE